MSITNHENTNDTIAHFDYPKPLDSDPDVYRLLDVLASETDRIDLDAEHLYDQRFIDSASGSELEKIGFEVGVKRRDGETDEHLRRRIYGAYAAQSSNTTYEAVAQAALTTIGATAAQISLETPPESGDKHINVTASLTAVEDCPLTEVEIVDNLERAISADASVDLLVEGTFGFDGDADNEGFNVGTWSSTVE